LHKIVFCELTVYEMVDLFVLQSLQSEMFG